jgi:hypothetical protein
MLSCDYAVNSDNHVIILCAMQAFTTEEAASAHGAVVALGDSHARVMAVHEHPPLAFMNGHRRLRAVRIVSHDQGRPLFRVLGRKHSIEGAPQFGRFGNALLFYLRDYFGRAPAT